ncbi:MAG: ABC transporter ATP-binding protein [Anaerolineaceae bacterium]|jgi:peptide/nickel transport system ATP-binding protein|nr:ABC transporter ATP-binding protein [Anaerolineaceae bacterium]
MAKLNEKNEAQRVATDGQDLLVVQNLVKYFPVQGGLIASILHKGKIPAVKAVDGVTFTIKRGEVFGLAGESGSGKSTIGRLVLRLYEPTRGKVIFDGIDLLKLKPEDMRHIRSRMQLVFQDPLAALNPRMTIGQAIDNPAAIHLSHLNADERRQAVLDILHQVGMNPPEAYYNLYPHQISGGQRQRIVLARALVTHPELVVADEPIAMADVSVRSILLDLMLKMKQEFNLTYLFITHDLATAKYICDRIGVLYLGKMCEMGEVGEVYEYPLHPYTQALLAAVPVPDPKRRRTTKMPEGEIPNPINPPTGCHFHPRCPLAQAICSQKEPEIRELRPGHTVACHFAENFLPKE